MLPDPTRESSWDSLRDEFIAGYFAVDPHFAVQQGRHEFDGLLPDWSPAGLQRALEFLRTSRERAVLFDAAGLDEGRQFERDYLVAVIDGVLFWQQVADWPHCARPGRDSGRPLAGSYREADFTQLTGCSSCCLVRQ